MGISKAYRRWKRRRKMRDYKMQRESYSAILSDEKREKPPSVSFSRPHERLEKALNELEAYRRISDRA